MNVGIIIFITLYCSLLICYFFTETSGNLKLRAPNKIALAIMFTTVGCIYAFKYDNEVQFLFLAALILSALGDVFLLFNFFRGGAFFLAGNICFAIYQIALIHYEFEIPFSSYWWVLIIIPVLWSIYPILFKITPHSFKFLEKYKTIMYLYLASITCSGAFGIVTMVVLPPEFFYLGLGLLLFMLSDFVIILHKFVYPKSKFVLRLNSALYFTGMLLIVLTFALNTFAQYN